MCVVEIAGNGSYDGRISVGDLPTFQLSFKAFCATAFGAAPASMASAKSLKAFAVMEASTVFTSDTFCSGRCADVKTVFGITTGMTVTEG